MIKKKILEISTGKKLIIFTEMKINLYSSLRFSTLWNLLFSHQAMLDSCHPMDYTPQGSSIHVIPQARILEWVAISFSRGFCPTKDVTHVSGLACRFFITEPPGNPLWNLQWGKWDETIINKAYWR